MGTPWFALLDIFTGIYKTRDYEDEEFSPENPPPPPTLGIRAFSSIFSLISRIPLLKNLADYLGKFIPLPGGWRGPHIKNLIRKGYKASYIVDKIAVVIVVEWVIGHLDKILENFNNNEYDLIYTNPVGIQCINYAQLHGCNAFSIQETIKCKICYKLALTNHTGNCAIGDTEFNYGIELIAQKLLFAATLVDFDYCKYVKFEHYDYIVCAGEYQRRLFQQHINSAKLFVMGSPRFDNYKDDKEAARQVITRQAGRDICWNKKTILWLATHSEVTSSINFAPMLSKVQGEFNIIKKPHSFIYHEIHDFENRIRSIIPEIFIVNGIDYINLMPAADFVICDYGGAVFSAIKADKNVILFNTPNPELLTGAFSKDVPVNIIRDRIINFYPGEEERFFAALKDGDIWEKQKEIRRQIRADFFTENPNPARDIAGLCRRIVKGGV